LGTHDEIADAVAVHVTCLAHRAAGVVVVIDPSEHEFIAAVAAASRQQAIRTALRARAAAMMWIQRTPKLALRQ
jgi:hypothetical protein